jgi:hypothetical protein
MRSAPRRGQILMAVALAGLATVATAVSVLAGGAPGPWPQ